MCTKAAAAEQKRRYLDFPWAELRAELSNAQASNAVVLAEWKYPSPLSVPFPDHIDDIQSKLQTEAIVLFKQRLPDYRIENLAVAKLVTNVIQAVKEQSLSDSNVVIIKNGCCTMKSCPMQVFYECVLDAIRAQCQTTCQT